MNLQVCDCGNKKSYSAKICRVCWIALDHTGENNNNYQGGRTMATSCACGHEKDYRASSCSRCAKRGYPIGDSVTRREQQDRLVREHAGKANTLAELSRVVGLSRNTVTLILRRLGLEVTQRQSSEMLFVTRTTGQRRNSTLKKRILQEGLLPHLCAHCGLGPNWCGEELALHLDHIDGNPLNDLLDNLRFLCPNCHEQTPTNKGKRRNEDQM